MSIGGAEKAGQGCAQVCVRASDPMLFGNRNHLKPRRLVLFLGPRRLHVLVEQHEGARPRGLGRRGESGEALMGAGAGVL